MKIRVLISIILGFGWWSVVNAQSPEAIMQKAAGLYSEGDYAGAISIYDSLYRQGLENEALYYNLGNSWYRKEEYPKAILFYEKALKLNPHNEDTRHNLALARQHIVDKIKPLPRFFLMEWWQLTADLFTEKAWCIISLTLWFSVFALGTVFFTSRRVRIKKFTFYTGVILLLFSIISITAGARRYHLTKNPNTAIVLTPTVNIKASPDQQSSTLFVIHQGTKIKLTDHLKGWYKIKLENGNIGWIKEDDFEKI